MIGSFWRLLNRIKEGTKSIKQLQRSVTVKNISEGRICKVLHLLQEFRAIDPQTLRLLLTKTEQRNDLSLEGGSNPH